MPGTLFSSALTKLDAPALASVGVGTYVYYYVRDNFKLFDVGRGGGPLIISFFFATSQPLTF